MSEARRGVLIGVDHGAKVIGLATCDAAWIVARPLQTFVRTTREADFAKINALIAAREAVGVVVGLPTMPEGFTGTDQAGTVRRWASRLAAAVPIPVYLWDESLSTFEAGERLAEVGGQADRLDAHAAAVVLQSFIDAHPAGTPLPLPIKHRG